MSENAQPLPVVLLILDGWGMAPPSSSNAITTATTPQWDKWCEQGTLTTLDASGNTVGLPASQMGNSEVGHMHIGAGRVILQDLSKINLSIRNQQFFKNETLLKAIEKAKSHNATIHLVGLVSNGGVHSHDAHLYALLELLAAQQIHDAKIHCITDGRDTAPFDAHDAITRLQEKLSQTPSAKIASIMGRFYAMDRDNRWERVEKAYQVMTEKKPSSLDALDIIKQSYDNNVSDEFIEPQACIDHAPIKDNDLVICFNYRSDRMREITYSLTDKKFSGFQRHQTPQCDVLTMTPYASDIHAQVIFPKETPTHTLGECIAQAHCKQLRLAETEKYAHVTFFLNGGDEAVFANEDRILVPSPKVETYDSKPEMSAFEVTRELTSAIASEKYTLIICNYANADMVGHTGDFDATQKAIEALDRCFKQIEAIRQQYPFELLITADHGNAEKMVSDSGDNKHTAHTSATVPFLHVGSQSYSLKESGSLIDIAPTVLYLLQLKKPQEMTGTPLITLD